MRTLTFPVPYDPQRIMDELAAAIPSFIRTVPGTRGAEAAPDCGVVEGDRATVLRVTFADNIAPASVQAVIAAHDPNAPKALSPQQQALQRLLTAATTDARLNDILVATGLKGA